jgi:GntR family transcriptional regulator/MocR family aminotransferase
MMLIHFEGDGALHQRLYHGLRAAILDGRLPPCAQLPSTRSLASEMRVSRNAVVAAFAQLRDEGYIEGRVGSGTYVSATLPDPAIASWHGCAAMPARRLETRLSQHARDVLSLRPLPAPGEPQKQRLRYDFRYSQPALEDFPHATWSRLVTRRVRRMSMRSMAYGRAGGFGPLREAVADYLRRARGVHASARQVIIVNGTQQALDLAGRMLIDRGDCVVVEEPCYQSARQVFLGVGARLIPAPVDADGLDVTKLPRGEPVRLAYVTPSHQFPLGSVLPLDRRLQLLRWAEQTGAYVLEDDYDSEFRYETRAIEALQGLDRMGRVLYMGSFSKVMFPSLRIGYLVVPEELVAPAAALKFLTDGATSTFEQEVLAEFIREGYFERHVRRMRVLYAERRRILIDALRQAFGDRLEVAGVDAGLHVVIYLRGLPAGAVPALVARAAQSGVGIYPVAPYYLNPPQRAGLILGYAALHERDIRAGVRAFAEAWMQQPQLGNDPDIEQEPIC